MHIVHRKLPEYLHLSQQLQHIPAIYVGKYADSTALSTESLHTSYLNNCNAD